MKSLRILTVLLLAGAVISCSKDSSDDTGEITNDSFDRGAMLANWADNIIIPAYTDLEVKTNGLKAKTADFVNGPSVEKLRGLRAVWLKAYSSFQHVSMFEVGKAEELRYRNRMNIYPTNTSKIEGFIDSGEYNFALPSTIDVQGFPALDYMLNGLGQTDAEITASYTTGSRAEAYKKYLTSLTASISGLTTQVLADWKGGFRESFVANTSSSATGSVSKMANDHIRYFEKSLRAGKIGIPAGNFSSEPLPQHVEGLYKHDVSKKLLIEALRSSRDFFDGKNFGSGETGESFKSYLSYLKTDKNGENLGKLIDDQFAAAKNRAEMLSDNLSKQITDDNSKMLATFDELQRIVILMKVDMVQALNISIDYVDADGD